MQCKQNKQSFNNKQDYTFFVDLAPFLSHGPLLLLLAALPGDAVLPDPLPHRALAPGDRLLDGLAAEVLLGHRDPGVCPPSLNRGRCDES